MTAAYQTWHASAWFARWLALARHAALLCACVWSACGASYYVATNGSATNSGAINAPWTLAYAIGNTSPATAGDTIYLRAGTYSAAPYVSRLNGSSGNPITIRPYASERVVIDGAATADPTLAITGSYTDVIGLEVTNSDTNRYASTGRSMGIDVGGNTGVADHCRVINCIVHDAGTAIGIWDGATSCEIYGCIIYNTGYQNVAPDRGHGHGIYAQSLTGAAVSENIILNTFDIGMHVYAQAAHLNNITLTGNVIASSGSLDRDTNYVDNVVVGGYVPATNFTALANCCYHTGRTNSDGGVPFNFSAGYSSFPNQDITILSNYFGNGALGCTRQPVLTVLGNTLAANSSVVGATYFIPGTGTTSFEWDYNTYRIPKSSAFDYNGTPGTYAAWQGASGFDAHSSFTTSPASTTVYFARANAYQTGRGHVAVYNWSGADNVSVDLSGVCQTGRVYQARNAADYFGAVAKTFTYTGAAVSLPMTNLTVATPIGGSAPDATGPTFNAFIISQQQTVTVLQAPIARVRNVKKTR